VGQRGVPICLLPNFLGHGTPKKRKGKKLVFGKGLARHFGEGLRTLPLRWEEKNSPAGKPTEVRTGEFQMQSRLRPQGRKKGDQNWGHGKQRTNAKRFWSGMGPTKSEKTRS